MPGPFSFFPFHTPSIVLVLPSIPSLDLPCQACPLYQVPPPFPSTRQPSHQRTAAEGKPLPLSYFVWTYLFSSSSSNPLPSLGPPQVSQPRQETASQQPVKSVREQDRSLHHSISTACISQPRISHTSHPRNLASRIPCRRTLPALPTYHCCYNNNNNKKSIHSTVSAHYPPPVTLRQHDNTATRQYYNNNTKNKTKSIRSLCINPPSHKSRTTLPCSAGTTASYLYPALHPSRR